MTLKLNGDLDIDILKMYLHTENEVASLRHSKLRAWIGKNTKTSQGQNVKKLRITSSVVVTDIPIKPQQFPTSSFKVARYGFGTAVTLTLDPWPWNWTMT